MSSSFRAVKWICLIRTFDNFSRYLSHSSACRDHLLGLRAHTHVCTLDPDVTDLIRSLGRRRGYRADRQAKNEQYRRRHSPCLHPVGNGASVVTGNRASVVKSSKHAAACRSTSRRPLSTTHVPPLTPSPLSHLRGRPSRHRGKYAEAGDTFTTVHSSRISKVNRVKVTAYDYH